jgi:hypothetical protein
MWHLDQIIRVVIKYLCKKEMFAKEIHEDFMDTLGKESLPIAQ